VSFSDPEAERRDIERRRLLAERLQAQSAQGLPPEFSQGRVVPEYTVGHGLTQLAAGLAGGLMDRKTNQREQTLDESRRKALSDRLRGIVQQPIQPGQPGSGVLRPGQPAPLSGQQEAAIGAVGGLPLEQQEQVVGGAGMQQLFPKRAEPEGFTLGQGQQRFDAQGNVVAGVDPREGGESGQTGSLQEIDRQNDFNRRKAAGQVEPWEIDPSDYLASRRGRATDLQLYAQYIQGLPDGSAPLSLQDYMAQYRGNIQGAETRATETTKIGVEAEADLPRVEQNAARAVETIDKLLTHPGFNGIFGASSLMQPQLISGSPWADAGTLLNQIRGKTFLEAYQSLKGGGAITETEGGKAEQAIGRLNQAQSEDAAREALEELKDIAMSGVERLKKRAAMGGGTAGAPATGAVVDGYRFKGGDPSQQANWEPQ
jgi:hypothetical protein